MSSELLFAALGFSWDRSVLAADAARPGRDVAVWQFRRALAAHVWDLSSLEGNPFTYPQVQTLLDGVTVGGHRLSDEQQVLRLGEASLLVAALAADDAVPVTKALSDRFNAIVATGEALEAGHFRGEGHASASVSVHLGDLGTHVPLPTEPGGANLRAVFESGLDALSRWAHSPLEAAVAYFAFAADQQFYFDGNKRTARCMMNVSLLSQGYSAVLVPAAVRADYNASMVRFLATRDATPLVTLLARCGPVPPGGPGSPTPSAPAPDMPDPAMEPPLGL